MRQRTRTKQNYFKSLIHSGNEVFMVVGIKIMVSWIVLPCSLVDGYQYSRGMCCLFLKGVSVTKVPCALKKETAHSFQIGQLSAKLHGTTSQITVILPQHLSWSHNQVCYSCQLLSFTLILSNQDLACISYFSLYISH